MSNLTNGFSSSKKNFFWVFQVFILACLMFLFYKTYNTGEKIAYVDAAKILNGFKGSKQAKQLFEAKAKVWQANIDTMTFDVKKAISGYEKSLAGSSAKEQAMAKQLIELKQKQLVVYQKSIQENAQKEDSKLTAAVVAKINGFLTSYGKEHHYKMILIANQSGTIAYAEEGLDITDKVLLKLNQEY